MELDLEFRIPNMPGNVITLPLVLDHGKVTSISVDIASMHAF